MNEPVPLVSVITTCKGRLEHLRQSLPRMVGQGPHSEVIVVDYDCPDGTAGWVRSAHHPVRLVEVAGEPIFNLARARNRGAAIARAPWLAFVDADVLLAPGFVDQLAVRLQAGEFYSPAGLRPELMGTVVCARSDFVELGGYDEAIQGWGGEDRDLYDRLTAVLRRRRVRFPADWVSAIEHGDAERVRFTGFTDRVISQRVNALYRMVKFDLLKLAGPGSFPLPLRERLHANVLRAVLDATAQGASSAAIGIDASQLPGVQLPDGVSATRRLQYEMHWSATTAGGAAQQDPQSQQPDPPAPGCA